MHDLIRTHFADLQSAISKTTITEQRQLWISTSLDKLGALYSQFRETNASRFGDEITRVVQAILRELESCPEARKLDADFRGGLHALHEELGIPKLPLKAAPAPPKPRKSAKK